MYVVSRCLFAFNANEVQEIRGMNYNTIPHGITNGTPHIINIPKNI